MRIAYMVAVADSMLENYRTGLLWKLFMSCPEIQAGLDKLGFEYSVI